MLTRISALVLACALALAGCARNKPLVLVAQTGQTLAGAIGTAARAVTQLQEGGVLTPEQALATQRKLQLANHRLAPLPSLLEAIDTATQQGQTDAQRIGAALDILRAAGVELDGVIAGLPVGETASNVLQAVTEARRLVAQITEALAKRQQSNHVIAQPALAAAQ
jgi:hypothetical protein